MINWITLILLIIFSILLYRWVIRDNTQWKAAEGIFPEKWRILLRQNVTFYNNLADEDKKRYEYKIQEFLVNCRITGVETEIDDKDRILVASSAVIPIFAFPDWQYFNIQEVLIYPNRFNHDFETEGPERRIAGMVGSGGYMDGVMILSRPALQHGFKNESDKQNTAIHEFVHLIDKTDGTIDGIPASLMEKQYTIPWIDLMNREIERIYKGESDIDPYGVTNRAEFFSVVSEYFFERPHLFRRKHPELFHMLEKIFRPD